MHFALGSGRKMRRVLCGGAEYPDQRRSGAVRRAYCRGYDDLLVLPDEYAPVCGTLSDRGRRGEMDRMGIGSCGLSGQQRRKSAQRMDACASGRDGAFPGAGRGRKISFEKGKKGG